MSVFTLTRNSVSQLSNVKTTLLRTTCSRLTASSSSSSGSSSRRHLSGGFSFAGPRNLNEIMKLELLKDKSKAEVSDIWMTYHEDKERVHGAIVNGDIGKKLIERAETS